MAARPETSLCPTWIAMPNFVVLGQTVWAKVSVYQEKLGALEAQTLTLGVRG